MLRTLTLSILKLSWKRYFAPSELNTDDFSDDAERPLALATIVSRLNYLLPGIRIKEKLLSLDTLSHQSIADVLGSDGIIPPPMSHC